MARSKNASLGGGSATPIEHELTFRLNHISRSNLWSLVKSKVTLSGEESINFSSSSARERGIPVIVAAMLVLERYSASGNDAVIAASNNSWERILAKKVHQFVEDASKPHVNTDKNYLHAVFGTTTVDGRKKPRIVRILRHIGPKMVRYQDGLHSAKIKLECFVNGQQMSDADYLSLLDFVCDTQIPRGQISPDSVIQSDVAALIPVRGHAVLGNWNCVSTMLTPLGPWKMGDKVSWGLTLSMNAKNEVYGTSWYKSPSEGGNKVSASVRGEFSSEGNYLQLRWLVDDPTAFGFGHHVLRLTSTGRTMTGLGVGHSSEGDSLFAIEITCVKAEKE